MKGMSAASILVVLLVSLCPWYFILRAFQLRNSKPTGQVLDKHGVSREMRTPLKAKSKKLRSFMKAKHRPQARRNVTSEFARQQLTPSSSPHNHLEPLQDRWSLALRGNGSRIHCRHPSASFGRSAWRLCYDIGDLRPPSFNVGKETGYADEGCLVVSIGIGGSWEFEDALAHKGCMVHAFDPTHELMKKHLLHVHDRPRMRYYFLGLGGGSSSAVSGSTGASKELYGSIGLERLRPLDHLMGLARAGRERRAIDVLKIDCEGCEWQAFNDMEKRTPDLLASVQYLLIELHMTPRYGLVEAAQLNVLMGHLIDRHGFRLFRKPRKNRGFPWARNETLPSLRHAGLDPVACCIELHFMRPGLTNAFASHAAWLARMEPAYKAVQAKQAAVPRKSGSRSTSTSTSNTKRVRQIRVGTRPDSKV